MHLKRKISLRDYLLNTFILGVALAMVGNVWIGVKMADYSASIWKTAFGVIYAVVALAATLFAGFVLWKLVSQQRMWNSIGFYDSHLRFYKKALEFARYQFPSSLRLVQALPNGEIIAFIGDEVDEVSFGIGDFGANKENVAEYLSSYFPCLWEDEEGNAVSLKDLSLIHI